MASEVTKHDRKEFLEALALLKPAVDAGASIQANRHMWFEKKSAMAYNGGLGIEIPFVAGVVCGVPGNVLMDLIATSPLKEVELDLPDNKAIVVALGKSKSKIAVMEAEDNVWPYPTPDGDEFGLTAEFVAALKKSLLVEAKPRTRIEHHGVILTEGSLYAFEGKTLSRITAEIPKAKNLPKLVLLPREFCQQIVDRCAKGANLGIHNDYYYALTKEIDLYSNVLDASAVADLPALVDRQMKAQPDPVAIPDGLDGALSRAEILARTDEPTIRIIVKKGVLQLKGSFALGTLNEELELKGKHPDVETRIVAPMVRRALGGVEEFSLTEDALALRGKSDYVYLIRCKGKKSDAEEKEKPEGKEPEGDKQPAEEERGSRRRGGGRSRD